MNEVDDAILEFFRDLEVHSGNRIALPPTPVYYTLVKDLGVVDRSPDTFSDRMNKLASEYGLLERVDESRGYYKITDKGIAYLDGELDVGELEDG